MLSLHKFKKHIFGHVNVTYSASVAHLNPTKVDNIYSNMSQICRTMSLLCKRSSFRKDPMIRRFNAEYRAVCLLINRSGFQNTLLFDNSNILRKSFHTSGQQNHTSPNNSLNMKEQKDPKNPKDMIFKLIFWSIIAYFSFYFLAVLSPQDRVGHPPQNVTWTDFIKEMLMKGEVEEVIVRPELEIITVVLAEGAVVKGKKVRNRYYQLEFGDPERFESKLRHTEELLGIKKGIPISYERSGEVLGRIITTLIILLILFVLRHRAKSMGEAYFKGMDSFKTMGKAEFTLIDSKAGQGKGVKFDDVAGLKEAKVEVMEFVDYLKNPDFYQQLGAKVPKGALLLGPPGCGKTLLAKAVATEAGVPFLSMNGSEFIEMIGGLGAARVRDLFKQAGKLAPCIIYIDEIDAVGKERAQGGMSSLGGGEEEQTLNQLLVEMDGMATREAILVLASTNRAEVLDKALLRPGRFDRHILIDLPNLAERKEIFEYHLGNIKLSKTPTIYSRRMASLTPGFSGADIANVCNEAALHAARDLKGSVEHEDLEYAIERTLGGVEKRNHAMSQQEKQIVAYHESGHALVGWLLEHTDALLKVTIVPRTNMALGFAQYSPRDQKLHSKEELFDQMCMALGGRVAEAMTFNRITTGAQNDLQKVTKIAYAQVEQFGMCDSVGLISFDQPEMGISPYSRALRNLMDYEARCLTDRAYYRTEELLKENAHKLKKIAEALLVKETLNYTDVEALIGPPTHEKKRFIDPAEFEMALDNIGPSREEKKANEEKDDTTNVQETQIPKTIKTKPLN